MSANGVAIWGLVLFVVGLATSNRGATVAGAYLAAVVLLGVAYSKASHKRVKYWREFSSDKASVGDEVTLRIGLENRKPLPVLWLKCDDEVPCGEILGALPTHPHYKPKRAVLRNVTYLKWFERVERQFTMKCLTRGVFTFGPAVIASGDVMGFKDTSVEVAGLDTLTVYPRMAAIRGISWDEHFPLGVSRAAGWIHPDPLAIVGTRPYVLGSPARHIAWRATGRTGVLQEKLLQPTVQRNIVVALSLSTSERYWEGVDSETLETAIFVCASICRELLNRGSPFGLMTNSLGPHHSGRFGLVVPPGSSRGHLYRTLGALATLRMPWMEFRVTLRALTRSISRDAGFLVIMPRQIEADWDQVVTIAGTGRHVTAVVLSCDSRFAAYYRRIPTYVVSEPMNWRTSEAIDFELLA